MKTKLLKLSEIVTTAGTQIRARIDTDTVDEYANAMLDATAKFPPVVTFHDGSQYILADGFHRVMAASRNGFLDIEAEIHKGTKADALKFALGANTAHGLKRTNPDKRRSVELALAEWPKLSSAELARICAVSDMLVKDVRDSNIKNIEVEQSRLGKDGKTRKLPKKKINPAPDEPEEPTQDERSDADEVTQAAIQTAGGTDSDPSRPVFHPRLDAIISAVEAAAFDLQAFQDGTEQFTPGAAEDVADALRTAAAAIISEGKRMKKLEAAND